MSAVPATKARRIGDILLELGFASEDALAKATIEQERTGQPLGQILVEHGVITRLELASALAEQWSDQSASIKLLPIPPPAAAPGRAPEPHDDDQYAARLQDAVAELAQRVGTGTAQPTEELDDRVTDLAERIEATVARTQRIEATLATLAESFEGVTGGVEEAFGALQSGMAGLALDLARIDTTVAELATPPEAPGADPALAAQLEKLGAAVAALSERSVADPATEGQLEALAARVESLRESDAVGDLRASLAAVEERLATLAERPFADPAEIEGRLEALAGRVANVVTPDEVVALHDTLVAFEQRLTILAEDARSTVALDEQARSLAELRATVVELESRPVGEPALDERLARIENQFAERLAAKPDTAEIEALASRFEVSAAEHEGLATAVAQLGVRIDELTWRDDGAGARLEELQERVEAVASALGNVPQGLSAEEQELAARLETLETRLTPGVVTPEDLSRALALARDDLTPAPAPLADPRVDDLARQLAALRDDQARDPRVDRLAEEITDVRARLAEVSAEPRPVSDPAVHERLEALGMRIEQLAGDRDAGASLAAKLDDLEQRLPSDVVTPDELAAALARARDELRDGQTRDPRVEQLVEDLSALRQELSDTPREPAPRAVDDSALRDHVDALARRIEELPAAEAQLIAKLEQLTHDLETVREQLAKVERTPVTDPVVASEFEGRVGALAARIDDLAESVATGSAGAAGPPAEDLERLIDERVEAQVAERLTELTRSLEERLAAAETPPRAGGSGTGDSSGLEDLLERNRMTIERLGLHLGEHDRALAELMRSRNLPKKLDELAARVDEISGGAPAAGAPQAPGTRREIGAFSSSEPSTGEVKALMRRVEDAEIASQADREKLMNRLERMASSIDWRLQRLEAAETATASSDED